ncbi:MAG TPA: tripartite tricarboxylate transporter substrate-binding protein [Beijerinckiaceae bacterium]|jgi:tripartite-type tricarboxylate transporter receptor subunit TctC|nr:tripartite tricarboxylate transporter substrate-binding protein [Beijerinckiaceae bacterium]
MLGEKIAKGIIALSASVVVGLLSGVANAQDFPTRPLKFVVGFGPGGLGDIAARAVAQKMSVSLGKPVVIENMPSAGGMQAAGMVARGEADGHTLLLVSGQNAISPSLFKSVPFDWHTDFAPVATISVFDFVIVTGKDSPLKQVSDLLQRAKANPAAFNMGTISTGSAQNLAALLFSSMAGVKMQIVPFRTTGDVTTNVLSDQIQAAFETLPGVMGQIQSGSLRALAVSSDKRVSFMPEVPTLVEAGVPGYLLISWNGVVVQKKTPASVIARLNSAINEALNAPDVSKMFSGIGINPRPGPPEALQAIYDTDLARWRKVIADANIPQQ